MATSRGGLEPRFTVMTSRPGVESSVFLLLEHAALPMAPVSPYSMMNAILPVGLLKGNLMLHHHAPPSIGACCFGSECSELTPAGCENGGGVFNGLGSSCVDNGVPPCMLPDHRRLRRPGSGHMLRRRRNLRRR